MQSIFLFTMFCNFRFELGLGIFWFLADLAIGHVSFCGKRPSSVRPLAFHI